MPRFQQILDFWFQPEKHPNYGEKRAQWFKKDLKFDALIQQNFAQDFDQAVQGMYLQWSDHAKGCLALILLFDQFSRNMFRDSPKAFSADGKAREITRHMIDRRFFAELPNFQKTFAILPFEHSEEMEDQILSVKLCREYCDREEIEYAEQHYEIIKKFSRFPHRNEILGRQSTPDEIEFLKQPGSSF